MATSSPAAVGTTNAVAGSVVQVKVALEFRVTYQFDTSATNTDLQLPYVVAVNGKVEPGFETKPRQLAKSRKFSVMVGAGSEVALFLNSDGHPDFRKQPVYRVRVESNDVLVKIKEIKGRHGHHSAVLKGPPVRTSMGDKIVEVYEGVLTGDIWMLVTHQYTVAEAEALMPMDTPAAIFKAVLSIYRGLTSQNILVEFPASDTAKGLRLAVSIADADNPREHITSFSLLRDGLNRVHPHSYLALFKAARAASISRMRITSGWRPMLGSIAHRAGLGLDVDYIETAKEQVRINRVALRSLGVGSAQNVSAEEKRAFYEYMAAKTEVEQSNKYGVGVADKKSYRDSRAREENRRKEWDDIRNKSEPVSMRTLRDYLGTDKSVAKLLDPWYVDLNTHDSQPGRPNEQVSKDEKNHANHLHISTWEPGIL